MRTYGQWAGNPVGTQEDTTRCVEEIYGSISSSYQCHRKRGYGQGGMYCKQHALNHPAEDAPTLVKYVASISFDTPALSQVTVIKETDKELFVIDSKNLIGSQFIGRQVTKDNTIGVLDNLEDAVEWLTRAIRDKIYSYNQKIVRLRSYERVVVDFTTETAGR